MNSICQYCHFLENGDPPDDHGCLLDAEKTFTRVYKKIDNDFGVNVSIELETSFQLFSEVWRDADSGEYKLSVSLYGCEDMKDGIPEDGLHFGTRIKYCPMCGKKLCSKRR